ARLIRSVYGEGENLVAPQNLTKALEAVLESPRHEWPTALCRRLWDFLAEAAEQRRRSPAHVRRWYNLVGYCLRPGYGDPLDNFRVDQLWKLLHAAPRKEAAPAAPRPPEGGAD